MSTPQIVDVIVVSYYTGDILFKCIESLLSLNSLGRIILINNGNLPEIEKKLTQLAREIGKITFITCHGNIGFSKACNIGANTATSPFLLFLNPDCTIADHNILERFISVLEGDAKYKVATCMILNNDGSIQKTCRRNLLTPLIALSESFNLYKFSNKFMPLNLPISEISELNEISTVPALSGAVIFTTYEYYQKIGGINEQYFLHVEDMDFCMKVHLRGDKIAFLKDVKVVHMLSTSETTEKFLKYHKTRGFIIYILKYFPKYNGFFLRHFITSLIYIRYFIKVYLLR